MRLTDARVFFTGTGGTGKTSVVEVLRCLYPGVKFLPSVSRQVQRDFGVTEKDQLGMDSAKRWEMQQAIFDRRWEQSKANPGPALSDRTNICMLAYALQRSWDLMSVDMLDYYMQACVEELGELDLLVYFPIMDFDVPDDGFRMQNEVSRRQHDMLVQAIMDEVGKQEGMCEVFVVGEGTPTDRAVSILADLLEV